MLIKHQPEVVNAWKYKIDPVFACVRLRSPASSCTTVIGTMVCTTHYLSPSLCVVPRAEIGNGHFVLRAVPLPVSPFWGARFREGFWGV